jgi:anti-sigma factor RsiW
MNCCEFRDKYSDFADGLMPSGEQAEARTHLATCAACRRFDAALRAGLNMLRALPDIGVSRGFGHRLRRRLRGEFAVRSPGMVRWSASIGTLLLMATAAFMAWDLLDSRAAHHGRSAWASRAWSQGPTPLATSGASPAFPLPMLVPTDPRFDAFHPLNSILVTAQTGPAADEGRTRLDLPAVWGGP